MRILIGRKLSEVDVGQIARLTAAHARTVVDVGAGDGRATLRAAADRTTLAIAIDASTDALRHGARVALRRHLPNALFVVSAIEALPFELAGIADAITVSFPWGSLLRGLVRAEPAVLEPLARLAKPGARLTALLSVGARDAATGLPPLEPGSLLANKDAYACSGLSLVRCRWATEIDIRGSGSSWAKRLDAGRARSVVALELRRR